MKGDLLKQCDQLPPCAVRLCARENGKARKLTEIAARANMTVQQVKLILARSTWSDVSVATATRLARACDVDLLRPRKKLYYLRRALTSGGIDAILKGTNRTYALRQINRIFHEQ